MASLRVYWGNAMSLFRKYPRTPHLDGSGLQPDDDLNTVSLQVLAGKYVVVEEKLDGANCGISLDDQGTLRLQSRGHYLTGGPRERQFELLKSWCAVYETPLRELLGQRYILYAEWLYAKHSTFYTDLPHYLFEFDIYDREADCFFSTKRRQAFLAQAPFIRSVPVLYSGQLNSQKHLHSLIQASLYVAPNQQQLLEQAALASGQDPQQVFRETDLSGLSEGLYLKVEDEQQVLARYKFVRPDFIQTILDSGDHWSQRPIIPNRLRDGLSIWDV
jgi:hypothetical protein